MSDDGLSVPAVADVPAVRLRPSVCPAGRPGRYRLWVPPDPAGRPRVLVFEVEGVGTRTVRLPGPAAAEVVRDFPPGARVAAFVVVEGARPDGRDGSGPVTHFRAD